MKTDKMTAKELKAIRFPKGATHIRVTNAKGNSVQEKKNASVLADIEGVFEFGTVAKGQFTPLVLTAVEATAAKAVKAPKAEKPAEAAKPATTAKVTDDGGVKAPSLGKCGGLFGFSVTAVLRALGKHGATVQQATVIMEAKEIEMSVVTVQIQVCAGRSGKRGEPAALTKQQLEELMTLAPAE